MASYATAKQPAPTDLTGQEAVEKVTHLLGQFQSAMMVTPSGYHLRVRPMAPKGKTEAFNGTLWFFADDRGRRTHESGESHAASLIFQDDRAGGYLHLIGRTQPVDGPEQAEALRHPIAGFLPGLNEPYLYLLRFDADRGYFWDSPGGTLRALASFTKHLVNASPSLEGRPPESTWRPDSDSGSGC